MNGNYKIVITKSAQKDKEKIKAVPSLKNNVDKLLAILRNAPFQSLPPFERLRGNSAFIIPGESINSIDLFIRLMKI